MSPGLKTGIVAVAAIVFAGVLAWHAHVTTEPVYQGKRLSEWLEEVNQAGSLAKTVRASEAIRAMGTNTLPFLLAYIEERNSPLKNFLVKLALKQSLFKSSVLESGRLFSPSLWAVKVLGANAKPLVPEFAKLLQEEDKSRSWRGEVGLWAIGGEAKPSLERLCQNRSERVRATAALVLARVIVSQPSDAQLRLRRSEVERGLRPIGGGDGWAWGWYKSSVSGRMRFSLGSVVTEEVVAALTRNLEHKDAAVRRASAEVLKRLGNQAKPVVPALLDALKDEAPAVREAAAEALKKIDPEAATKAGVK